MNAELRPLLNFILNHTQFSFKEVPRSPMGDDVNHQSPYEWFINQEHIPFSISDSVDILYKDLYKDFLQELYQLYLKTNSEYSLVHQRGKTNSR